MQGQSLFLWVNIAILLISAIGNAAEQNDNCIFSSDKGQQSPKVNEEVPVLYISCAEWAIKEEKELYVNSVMEKIGKSYTSIMLSITAFNMEGLQEDSISSIFLEAILAENRIRQVEGLEQLQIYFHIPADAILDFEVVKDFLSKGAQSGAFSGWRGIVTGVIFDSDFLPTSFDICRMYHASSSKYPASCTKENTGAVASGIKKVDKLMKRFRDIFGDEMKMGLSVDHSLQCVTVRFVGKLEFLSRVDLILYNGYEQYSDYFGESDYSNFRYDNCRDVILKWKAFQRVTKML